MVHRWSAFYVIYIKVYKVFLADRCWASMGIDFQSQDYKIPNVDGHHMSANNYTLIHKVGEKYYIWYNLNAERAIKNEILTEKNAIKIFDTLGKAIEWVNKNDMTEYGYQVNNLRKPKDNFKEKIKVTKVYKL